jgi:hypothetical protein
VSVQFNVNHSLDSEAQNEEVAENAEQQAPVKILK